MKLFAISFVVFVGAVLAEAFNNSNLNENLNAESKTKTFRISEKSVPVIEHTYSRSYSMHNGIDKGMISHNWHDEQPKALPYPEHNPVNWDYNKPTYSKAPLPPNFKSYGDTPSGNWNSGYQTVLGQQPQNSIKTDVKNFGMSHNNLGETQHSLQMESHFIHNGLDKMAPFDNLGQPQDLYNSNRNTMGWKLPELKDRQVYQGNSFTKTQFTTNRENIDATRPENLEVGHQTFMGQRKDTLPISSSYMGYPEKRNDDWRVGNQQHQMETNFHPNGVDQMKPTDNWRVPQDWNDVKGNNVGWKGREDFRREPFTKTGFNLNGESNDMTYPGYVKDGHQPFEPFEPKPAYPISSVFVDYPGKRHNEWDDLRHEQQMTLLQPEGHNLNQVDMDPNEWEIETINPNDPSYEDNVWNLDTSTGRKSKHGWLNNKSKSKPKWRNIAGYLKQLSHHNPNKAFNSYNIVTRGGRTYLAPLKPSSLFDVQRQKKRSDKKKNMKYVVLE